LQYKIAELDQRKQEDSHSYDYALKALETQKEDRTELRKIFSTHRKAMWRYSLVSLLIVLAFFWLGCE